MRSREAIDSLARRVRDSARKGGNNNVNFEQARRTVVKNLIQADRKKKDPRR